MARYSTLSRGKNLAGKPRGKNPNAVYGTLDPAIVNAGIATGDYVLLERTTIEKIGTEIIERPDRRYIPKDEVQHLLARDWRVVEMTGAERSIATPSEVTKRGPGRPRKEAE